MRHIIFSSVMYPPMRWGAQSNFSDENRKRERGLYGWRAHREAPGITNNKK